MEVRALLWRSHSDHLQFNAQENQRLENAAGVPVYVHAKICIVDDVWFTCGSDNFNRRSWTSDSELTCAVMDTKPNRGLARELRLAVWSEHLRLPPDDPVLLGPAAGFEF